MPPDDTGGPGDDLPGLHDDSAPSEADAVNDGPGDAGSPELDDSPPSSNPDLPTEATGTDAASSSGQWTDAELDEWFENDFGGDARFSDEFGDIGGDYPLPAYRDANDDLRFGVDAYERLASRESPTDAATTILFGAEENQWRRLGRDTKERFRRGWADYESSLESVVGELAPLGSNTWRIPSPKWIFMGGGILGLVLAVGFVLNDGDDPAVAVPSDTPVVETVAPSTAVLVEDTEAPAVAVDTPEVPLVIDPGDYVRCREATVVADLNGDAWIMATPAAPWLPGPGPETTWSLILDVGIDLGTQTNTVRWTLYDGSTRGESHISGDNVKAALDSEMWVTPEGQVAVKLPGTSPTGGLSVADIGPDAGIIWFGQLWPQEDSELQQWDETKPLGEVTQVADALPRPGWERVETDFGPLTLIIPDTSDD